MTLERYVRGGRLVFFTDAEREDGKAWIIRVAAECGAFASPFDVTEAFDMFSSQYDVHPETREFLIAAFLDAARYEPSDTNTLTALRNNLANARIATDRADDALREYDESDTDRRMLEERIKVLQKRLNDHIEKHPIRKSLLAEYQLSEKELKNAEDRLRAAIQMTVSLTQNKKLVSGVTVAETQKVIVSEPEKVIDFVAKRLQELEPGTPLHSDYRNVIRLDEKAFNKMVKDGRVSATGLAEVKTEYQVRIASDLTPYLETGE